VLQQAAATAAAWTECTKKCSADALARETPTASQSPARKSGAFLLVERRASPPVHLNSVPRVAGGGRAGGRGFTRLHNQRRGCPILARPLRKSGNHTDRTMGFAFHAAVSALRYRHPFQSCHPERNFVIGKANDKGESKDPYVCPHRSRQRKAFSPRGNRPGGPFLAAPSQEVGNHTDRTMGFAFHAASAPNERA
jgi:hypothetical protein